MPDTHHDAASGEEPPGGVDTPTRSRRRGGGGRGSPAPTPTPRCPKGMDMAGPAESASIGQPRQLKRGDVIEGVVMSVERDGLLVDIGFKSEGIVPTGEMHSLGSDPLSKVAVGDKVHVFVVQPETSDGQVALSVDRARGEQGWMPAGSLRERGDLRCRDHRLQQGWPARQRRGRERLHPDVAGRRREAGQRRRQPALGAGRALDAAQGHRDQPAPQPVISRSAQRCRSGAPSRRTGSSRS